MSTNRKNVDYLRNFSDNSRVSVPTSYHLLDGSLSVNNSVVTAGMATTLYTGNGTTQSVVTGVDMATQWGNDVTEKFGGLVWLKSRSAIANNFLYDTASNLRTISNGTNAGTAQTSLSLSSTGINLLDAGSDTNANAVTYASWNFQTTHRITGTTNHGKTYTCHYNPFTGFTMVKYEGSGLAGHEIPHHLGRKLGFVTTKNLAVIQNWLVQYKEDSYLTLNTTNAEALSAGVSLLADNTVVLNASSDNTSTNQHIMYGWANSYFDEANTLIGNYEVGVYQGTGAAGNKVTTRGKPAWIMIKMTSGVSQWVSVDNQRLTNNQLYLNLSNAETSVVSILFTSDGFTLNNTTNENTAGGQYLYMVVYDNDSGSGKSKYNKATDTSALSLTATIPFANGLDTNGTKNTVLTKNETVTGLTLTQGKNYVYAKNDGLYGVKAQAPQYGSYNGFGDYFEVNTNKWYQSPSVFSDTMDATTNWIADEALGGTVSTISSVNGELKILNNGATYGAARRVETTVVGKKYRIVILNTSISSSTTTVWVGTSLRAFDIKQVPIVTSIVTFVDFVAPTTTTHILIYNQNISGVISTWDNYAIYPINDDGSVDITSATPITESRNYLDAIVYADAGGQPTYIEQLPKIEYKKDMEVDTIKVLSGFDLNQKWYNMTASRVVGATYTNTTGKPIFLSIVQTSASSPTITVDGIGVGTGGYSGYGGGYVIVPNGSKYSLASGTISTWAELR